jgi:hypothetical protein
MKEVIDKGMLMLVKQPRAETKPPAAIAPKDSREQLKESQEKMYHRGFPPPKTYPISLELLVPSLWPQSKLKIREE